MAAKKNGHHIWYVLRGDTVIKVIIHIVALILLLSGCLTSLPIQAKAAKLVSTAETVPSPEYNVRVLLIPRIETILSAETSARIEDVTVGVGDRFSKGDLLVKLNCLIYQAELQKAQAMQKEAEKIYEVNKRLGKLGSISELESTVTVTRLEQAKAESAIKEYLVSKCSIHAPFSGGVIRRIAAPYQYITPGQPVLEIIDTQNIDVQMHIPSQWLTRVQLASSFSIVVDEVGRKYDGVVTALGVRIDPVSQTLEVRGNIKGENPELLAGMSGFARFVLQK
jgi:membrane fusion protein, multidrug efflux system